jgi:beta-galactosidase/beta-glucuronidase
MDSNPSVRYYSGTATYQASFSLPSHWTASKHPLELDLGTVKNVAEISLNGHPIGILWKKPYRIDITDALKAGDNDLVIKVTNLWVNRLIGDQQKEAAPVASSSFNPYTADSPLLESGLMGPVSIVAVNGRSP